MAFADIKEASVLLAGRGCRAVFTLGFHRVHAQIVPLAVQKKTPSGSVRGYGIPDGALMPRGARRLHAPPGFPAHLAVGEPTEPTYLARGFFAFCTR